MPARGHGAAGRRGRRRRIARSADFDRVFRQGRSHANRWLVLHVFPRGPMAPGEPTESAIASRARDAIDQPLPRLGVSVGRKVGGAVERNRVKRVLREAFWALAPELPEDHDFVLVARPDAAELARREGKRGIGRALRDLVVEAGLVGPAGERA